jgi:rubrerythrin
MEASDQVARRLLGAWRGEVEAGATYAALAEAQRDPRRAEIIRKLAANEVGHRQRLERRMAELGIPIPDPNRVRLSPWAKLQVRFAPTERVLAAREAAEDAEVREGYARPTGDQQTDALFGEIRADERAHRGQVRTLRDAGAPALSPAGA